MLKTLASCPYKRKRDERICPYHEEVEKKYESAPREGRKEKKKPKKRNMELISKEGVE